MIVDLTMDICDGMLTYPAHWHPRVEVNQLGRHGVEGRETRRLVMGTHTGTHIDAPRHFIRDGVTVDLIPLVQLNGPAILLDFTQRPVQEITKEMVVNAVAGRVCGRVLMRFDWDKFNDSSAYYRDHPYLTTEAAQWLIDRGCALLGMDTPSPDMSGDEKMFVHKRFLGQGVVLVEYLTGLSALPMEMSFHLTVAPLKLKGCDGAPARVFATF